MDAKDILRQRRIELDMTMKDLANRLGVSESTISRWESGNIASMKHKKIAQISEVLGISPSLLVPGMEDTRENADGYYNNAETAELADRLKNQEGMRILFDASRNAKPEDLKMVAGILNRLKGEQ